MKERMFSARFSLKASLLLLGIFLVLAEAFYPPVVAAQTVSCDELKTECDKQCKAMYANKEFEITACMYGCRFYCGFCHEHHGHFIKASVQREIFLAEATLHLFEKMVDKEHR